MHKNASLKTVCQDDAHFCILEIGALVFDYINGSKKDVRRAMNEVL